FLRGEPAPIQHVEEIGVAAGIELIGAFDFYAALAEEIDDGAVENRRAHLRFDIVADERQVLIFEALYPGGIARDENRDVIDEAEPGLERTGGVKARGFFRADRQIIRHDLRAGVAQLFDDLFAGRFFFERKKGPLRIVVPHVRGIAVKDATHHHDGAG